MELGFTKQELFDGGIFIMLVGPPGAGKSEYAKKLKMKYMNFEIISPDDIREEITGDRTDQSRNVEVFEKVYRRIAFYLNEGYNIIYDATNCRSAYRFKVLDFCKNITSHVVCIIFKTPLVTCLERNKNRDRYVPDDVIETMYINLRNHPPTINEGYEAIFTNEVM